MNLDTTLQHVLINYTLRLFRLALVNLAQHKDSYGTSWELRAPLPGGYVDLVGNDNAKSHQWHNSIIFKKQHHTGRRMQQSYNSLATT